MEKQSFEQLDVWKEEFTMQVDPKDPESFPFVVVGNKCDREDRKVPTDKARKWCSEHGDLKLFETSAKSEIGVEDSFRAIAKLAGAREKEEEMYFLI